MACTLVSSRTSGAEELDARVGVAADDGDAVARNVSLLDGKGDDAALVPGDEVPPAFPDRAPPILPLLQPDEARPLEPGDGVRDGVKRGGRGLDEGEEPLGDLVRRRRDLRG